MVENAYQVGGTKSQSVRARTMAPVEGVVVLARDGFQESGDQKVAQVRDVEKRCCSSRPLSFDSSSCSVARGFALNRKSMNR